LGSARAKGVLKKWFNDKGYGFITPAQGSKDVFIHISAFDRNTPRQPKPGDTIFYHVTTDKNGRLKAADAAIEGAAPISPTKPTRSRKPYKRRKSSWKFLVLCSVLLIGAGAMLFNRLQPTGGESSRFTNTPAKLNQAVQFTCSGKTHCSEMTSCEEAKFYIRNCPNTKMDGDGDGIPCERQWCN
jgi:cold shock CspA family protein